VMIEALRFGRGRFQYALGILTERNLH
jgi:hypothetical protein